MLALSQDVQQNRPVEAREHIRRFHELFFTLSPDKSAIESNIQRALYLSDESAHRLLPELAGERLLQPDDSGKHLADADGGQHTGELQ